ncbi:MAG: cupin domain-containing protein [Desulfovibrionales bacterium]
MQTLFFPSSTRTFEDHPKFAGVRIAVLVSRTSSDVLGVSLLEIAPGVDVPAHVHDLQIDSIYVISGQGEALINGGWQPITAGDYVYVPPQEKHGVRNIGTGPLELFVHHSPPLF